MRARYIGVLVGLLVALAACGGGDDSDQAGNAGAVATPTVGSTSPSQAASPGQQGTESSAGAGSSSGPSSSPSGSSDPNVPVTVNSPGPKVVVSGVVKVQAEAGCLTLGGYELVTDSALWYSVLASGETVRVTGYVDKGRVPRCQQPKTLVVTDIRP